MSTEDGSDDVEIESIHQIAMAVVNAVSSVAGIIGNMFVLIVLLKNKDHFQGINLFIAALAVADLTVCSIVQPVFIYLLFGTLHDSALKAFENIVFAILIQMSLNLLLSIAIIRFIEISFPFFYRSFATKIRMFVVIGFVCVVSAVQGVLFNRKLMRSAEPFFQYATIAAFLVIYARIYLIAKRHRNEITCQARSLAFNHSGMTVSRLMRLTTSTITTGIITGTFVVCLLPFSIVNLVDQDILHSDNDEVVTLWATTIVCCNSSMNAYIYTLRSKTFKDAIAKTLRSMNCLKLLE